MKKYLAAAILAIILVSILFLSKSLIQQAATEINITVGNPPVSNLVGVTVTNASILSLTIAVNRILSCEGGGKYAPSPSCVNKLSIPKSFKDNLSATYPGFTCGQFIWSAQRLMGWTVFPGWVHTVYQWYTMHTGHKQTGYAFLCNPYVVSRCTTSKTDQAKGAIAPGDIILYGSTGRNDPGHIAIVIGNRSKTDLFNIRVVEANYRHGVVWFRWTNLKDNLGRGANILGWWRKQ